ncbi:MAG TPA: CRISPR-associated RAMP protein [Cyanobacteria bacterium UBA8553]|nr:CRISPR-associated RAMP protein [Cyanobacteria bacterium UBA8553]HAJ61818.1 CRISPR-associated RAMP protein [Cyanobacteria bacterium UBA8543]
MFDTFKNRLELTGTLTTVTALRISAGRSTEPIGSDLPVIKDALGRPLIPGASFKGALRSRLESFLRGIDPSLAEDPANFTSSTKNNQVKAFKEQHKDNDLALTQALIGITDDVSRLFGSPWIASKFQVRDLTVLPENWFGQYQERDGVAIDRDTETAADGKLYDFQVVPAGTPFEFKAVVENAEEWELGLLMIGLHQFETEQIPLGGGRSRGLGVVKLEVSQMQWFDTEDDPNRLLTYLQNIVKGEITTYQCSPERQNALKQDWTDALITHLRQEVNSLSKTQVT